MCLTYTGVSGSVVTWRTRRTGIMSWMIVTCHKWMTNKACIRYTEISLIFTVSPGFTKSTIALHINKAIRFSVVCVNETCTIVSTATKIYIWGKWRTSILCIRDCKRQINLHCVKKNLWIIHAEKLKKIMFNPVIPVVILMYFNLSNTRQFYSSVWKVPGSCERTFRTVVPTSIN